MMKTLVVGTRASFPYQMIEESLEFCTGDDQIVVTGSVPVDDLAARYAFENGISLRTEVLDTQLHGTNARNYMMRKLIPNMDRIVFFDSGNDELLDSLFEYAESQKKETIYLSTTEYRSRIDED
jgi:hypothetical protein